MAVARWLETDTYSNKDISTAVSIGVYTADADRVIVCDVSIDQAAGNGDYVVYLTRQINGSGSSYVLLPKTTCAAASGETAIAMQSGMVTVRSGDVVTCYIDGLAGDNANPDTTVRWFELAALRPTTADRTLDVSSGGEAGIDWANVGSPTTTVNLSGTTVKTATDVETDTADIQNRLPAVLVSGRIDSSVGAAASNAITAAALAADVGTEIAGAVRTELATELAIINALDTSAVTITTSNDAGQLTIYRGVTFAATVSGLTISASWTKVYLTIKSDLDLADTAATVQVVETNPGAGTDGLLYLNGAAPVVPITYADAALVVNQAGGTVAITLSDNLTAQLSRARSLHWDLKEIVSGTTSTLLTTGSADVELTSTRTI